MTAQELIKWLEPHGYTIQRSVGSHVLMKNPSVESIVVVPTGRAGELPPSVIMTIKKNVVEKGVVSEQDFNKAVNRKSLHRSA